MMTFTYLVSMFVIWAWLYNSYTNPCLRDTDLTNGEAVLVGLLSLIPFFNTVGAVLLMLQSFAGTAWASKRFSKNDE